MYEPAPPLYGIPGTVQSPRDTGTWRGRSAADSPEHSSGAGYATHHDQRFYLAMHAQPSAVPHARQCTRHTLATWHLSHVAADTELIVSELLTNAVRASPARTSAIALYLAADTGRLYVLVYDNCPHAPPRPAPADNDADNGRGLSIVDMLSEQYGTVIIRNHAGQQHGKVIWSRIRATPSPEQAATTTT